VGLRTSTALVLAALILTPLTARAILPDWLQHIIGSSTIEAALYRTMHLPEADTLYPRPPKEAQSELARLIGSTPDNAELYQLRARTDEQALDERAAEADWKLYGAHAKDHAAAQLELAGFYQRRLMIPQAIAALSEAAAAPAPASETYLNLTQQRSWIAYDRLLFLASDQALPPSQTASVLTAFLNRYPDQPAVYALNLKFLLQQKDRKPAGALIARYRRRFPEDNVFPTRAEALIAESQGDSAAALAVYDRAFAPLWPPELIQSYFALLDQSHRQRAFVAEARARLAAHPDGPEALNALARIFYYDQQAGRLDAAQGTLDAFRVAREARKGAWTPLDLYTLATLAESTHAYAESARYHYALASSEGTLPNGEPAAEAGLAGLVHTLLEAPDQPLALGAQNLTLYRDIATLDQGPGYWNGILSLWLNGNGIHSAYNAEDEKAQSYFHRAKAAELLADLDKRFPNAPERSALHAELLHAISQYGEPATVISEGKAFLASFPAASQRLEVADLMADAYAQQNDTADEFALYESQLAELAAKTDGMPLSAAAEPAPLASAYQPPNVRVTLYDQTGVYSDNTDLNELPDRAVAPNDQLKQPALTPPPARRGLPAAAAYSRELDRYLGRLTATGNLPRALSVLRTQLNRNPGDPLLYEKLATFLQQNNLSAEQEKTFELAIARFQQPTWYDKLARLYLREKKQDAFAALTRKVTEIFSGTDLDAYFRQVNPGQPIGPQLALQLNLYAAKRFPHDLVFTRNLLRAYQAKPTNDPAAYEAVLRRVWWESPELETEFVTFLSRTGKLDTERAALASGAPSQTASSSEVGSIPSPTQNPAATRELASIDLFLSHYEQATPLFAQVADAYPADPVLGDIAVSLFRSQAYLDPTQASTQRAVALETNLLNAAPDNVERLATLGDLYAEATSTGGEDFASAAPYWQRMTTLHPGSTQGFLLSATIFWDYFQFDSALAQLDDTRTRFHSPSLFAYEAGAIEENRHNLPAAIAEYTSAALHPIDTALKQDSVFATLGNFFKPPSDAANSNLWATAQSFVGTPEASGRLLTLARRKSTAALVDQATASAFTAEPNNPAALTLRADVLAAQHHAPELNALLTSLFDQALSRATTFEQAQTVGNLAQSRNLTPVYEQALAKQAQLTPDPVQKIELQYALVRSLEAHKEVAAAARIIDAVYRANPRTLGVVRATTDFYARNDQPGKAIGTLLEAAKAATPDLTRDFTLEAANRANDAGDPAQARALATALLEQTPYDARVIAVVSTSYARAHDDTGLKQFFLARLALAGSDSKLTRDERRQNIALLRRGLIPALTRSKDYAGATAQYIALLSAFPEDTATAQEAALYARRYDRQAQLVDFLRTTVHDSPKDSRFAALLGQVETTFGDLPAAEAAWSQAVAIRQDRADFYTARVNLELRLSQTDRAQFDLAAKDFARLYLLTYHDPSWMVRLAELRARQQRPDEAVKALRTAYLEGHAETASDNFTVANQLSKWNLLAQAEPFVQRGVNLAGSSLLTPKETYAYPQPPSGAVIYARVLTRLGKATEALITLQSVRKAAEVSATWPSVLAAELARENLPQEEAESFRQNFAQRQRQTADEQLRLAVSAIGATVQTYYTPEQKQSLAESLDRLHETNANLALQTAAAAGLADREAAWRKQILLAGGTEAAANLEPYSNLERRRLAFAELAQTLEAYAPLVKPAQAAGIREQAAKAFRDAGDTANEMRVERALILRTNNDLRDRYFNLLLRRDRAALTALAGNKNNSLADAAVNYAVAHASEAQALAAVARRGQALPAVWRPASASLLETYFASGKTAATGIDDFTQSLASNVSIGARLGTHANPSRQLTGDTYFYYASRFGIFLATVPKASALPDAEDFLPAELEVSPSSPESYRNLARSYAEAGQTDATLNEYNHVLELAPATSDTPAIEDEIALVLYRANRRDAAKEHWHSALRQLFRMQQHAIYPEQFFTSFRTILDHLGTRHLAAEYRPEITSILSGYLARNGNYRSNELLKAVYISAATPQQGAAFVAELAGSASDPLQVLDDLRQVPWQGKPWLSEDAVAIILQREVELARNQPQENSGFSNRSPTGYQGELLELYFAQNKLAQAEALLKTLPDKDASRFLMDRIILAVRTSRIATLVDSWRADPETLPTETDFNSALYRLQTSTPAYEPNPAQIRPLAEFLFEHKQQDDKLVATDYLSLAKLRLDTNDLPGALELLHQLALLPGTANDTHTAAISNPDGTLDEYHSDAPFGDVNPYVNTDSAANLLEKTHHPAEALPFLQSLVQLVPWNATYRLRLAEAQRDSGAKDQARNNLLAVAKDPAAAYDTRDKAASDLAAFGIPAPADLGSKELTFLAHPTTPEAARQPYASASRAALAVAPSTSAKDRDRLLREAIAIAPSGLEADRNRLNLLLAQPADADASATLAILNSMQDQSSSTAQTSADAENEDAADSDAADTPKPVYGTVRRPSNTFASLPPLAHMLDVPTQIRLATQLATANQRDGDLAAALDYAELAVTLAQDAAKSDPALIHRRDDLKAQLQLEQRNAVRRPHLQNALAQPTQVRPRLTASALAPDQAQEDSE
jgi:hypothetical protein